MVHPLIVIELVIFETVLMQSWKNFFIIFLNSFLGAGKTFTMLGTDREPGIMARALNDLFYEMDRTKEDMKYKVSMSYLEVRNVRNG